MVSGFLGTGMAGGPDRGAAIDGLLVDFTPGREGGLGILGLIGLSGAKESNPQRRMWLSWSISTSPTARSSPV
jgi:hypothetical protein